MSKTYSNQIIKAQILLQGMTAKASLIKDKGLDSEFMSNLESDCKTAESHNEELDKLKAEVREKTAIDNRKLEEI